MFPLRPIRSQPWPQNSSIKTALRFSSLSSIKMPSHDGLEFCQSTSPQTTRESGFHPQLRRFPTCIGRDAAPVWCHPRQREEASKGHSSLEGGRHPTEARQVVANPRIAAGSTVGSDWLRLFRDTKGQKTSCKPEKICCQLLSG